MNQPATPRPAVLAPCLENQPAALRALPQWVLWRLILRDGRWTKQPINATNGESADSTNPETWAPFEVAANPNAWRGFKADGLGYVFSAEDEHFGVDLDGCRSAETGEITEEARYWIARFNTYTEVSPSGTGVKIIGVGAVPGGRGRRNASAGVECYDRERYFTMTGHLLEGSPATVNAAQEALDEFHQTYFPAPAPKPARQRTAPAAGAAFDGDDAALLSRANAATNGASFAQLWNGNIAGYPGPSEADMGAIGKLAFWTGDDPERIEKLMRRSALYREKWDEKRGDTTYLGYTISKVLAGKTEYYQPGVELQFRQKSQKVSYRDGYRGEGGEYRGERGIKKPLSIKDNLTNLTESAEAGSEGEPDAEDEAAGCDDPEGWETPVPFGAENLPGFPLQALPAVLRDFVAGTAREVGTSVDLPAVQSLAAVAATVQKRVVVAPKEGHREPASLWCVSIAPPGSRKSEINRRVRAPIAAVEAAENEERAPLVEESLSRERVARTRLTRAEGGAAKPNPDVDALAELDDARRALRDLRPVRPVRLLADDATPEALAVMLSENGGRLAVLDAEGVVFGHMVGRYTDKPAVEIYLKAHSGETFTQDRAGGSGKERRTVRVHHAALTLGVSIQPEVLAGLRKKRELVGVGALARCLFSFAQDNGEGDEYDTYTAPVGAVEAYRNRIEGLLSLPPLIDRDDEGEPVPYPLSLTPEALEQFAAFYRRVRQQIRDEGEGPFAEWLAKSHGAALRLAAVLHMADKGAAGVSEAIGAETMEAAFALTDYFTAHASAAFARVREDEATEHARKILGWVKRNRERVRTLTEDQGGVSIRDFRRQIPTIELEELQAALYLLAARGYAREIPPEEREAGTPGRKPSAKWLFHPSLTWSVEV